MLLLLVAFHKKFLWNLDTSLQQNVLIELVLGFFRQDVHKISLLQKFSLLLRILSLLFLI